MNEQVVTIQPDRYEKNCCNCGIIFTTNQPNAKYHNDRCKYLAKLRRQRIARYKERKDNA